MHHTLALWSVLTVCLVAGQNEIQSMEVTLTQGEDATLYCTGTSNKPYPTSVLRWTMPDVIYTEVTRKPGERWNFGYVHSTGRSLELQSVIVTHAGKYTCVVEINNQEAYYTTNVIVSVPPPSEYYRTNIIVGVVAAAVALVLVGGWAILSYYRWENRHARKDTQPIVEAEASTSAPPAYSAKENDAYEHGIEIETQGFSDTDAAVIKDTKM